MCGGGTMMKEDIIISNKLRIKLDEIKIELPKRYRGEIKVEGGGLWLLKDLKKKTVCGILDVESFLDALLDTNMSQVLLNGWQN